MRIRWNQSGGFSLIDLLALTSVTSVLLAFSLPSINSSRDTAWQSACLNNQRQLAGALAAYAADHQDEILSTQNLPGGGFWGFPFIQNTLTPTEARNLVQDVFKESSPLFPYLKRAEVIHCPGDFRASKLQPGSGWAFDSYAKTEPMNGGGWQPGIQTPYKKMSEIETPEMTLAFVESSDPRDYNRGTWVMNAPPPPNYIFNTSNSPSWVDMFGMFHGNESSFSYVDGHADVHTWRDKRIMQASEDANNGKTAFFWPGGNIENPDFRWVYQRYRFKGWSPLRRTQE